MANIKQKYKVTIKVKQDNVETTETYFKFNEFEGGGISVSMTIEQAEKIGKLAILAKQNCCAVNHSQYGEYIAFKTYAQDLEKKADDRIARGTAQDDIPF